MSKVLCICCLLALCGASWASPGTLYKNVERLAVIEEYGNDLQLSNKPLNNKRTNRFDQVLLIPESTNDVVGMYDPYDGTYLGDLIVNDTTGIQYNLTTPINAIQGPDGDIYLSDQVSKAVFVFDTLGNYQYTYADTSDGLNNVRGIDFRDDHLFVTSGDEYVAEFDGPHSFVRYFVQDSSDPFDILFLEDGRLLLSDIQGATDNVRLYDTSGTFLYELFTVSFPEQIQVDYVLPGAFLNNAFSAGRITDFELDGTIVDTMSFTYGRGIYRLGNGNLLATSGSGVFEIDSATGSIVEQENTGSARFIELYTSIVSVGEIRDKTGVPTYLNVRPNPFISSTTIHLLGEQEHKGIGAQEIKIYNLSGRLVKQFRLPTAYSLLPTVVKWDGRDNDGRRLPGGVYFLRFKAGEYTLSSKLLLIR